MFLEKEDIIMHHNLKRLLNFLVLEPGKKAAFLLALTTGAAYSSEHLSFTLENDTGASPYHFLAETHDIYNVGIRVTFNKTPQESLEGFNKNVSSLPKAALPEAQGAISQPIFIKENNNEVSQITTYFTCISRGINSQQEQRWALGALTLQMKPTCIRALHLKFKGMEESSDKTTVEPKLEYIFKNEQDISQSLPFTQQKYISYTVLKPRKVETSSSDEPTPFGGFSNPQLAHLMFFNDAPTPKIEEEKICYFDKLLENSPHSSVNLASVFVLKDFSPDQNMFWPALRRVSKAWKTVVDEIVKDKETYFLALNCQFSSYGNGYNRFGTFYRATTPNYLYNDNDRFVDMYGGIEMSVFAKENPESFLCSFEAKATKWNMFLSKQWVDSNNIAYSSRWIGVRKDAFPILYLQKKIYKTSSDFCLGGFQTQDEATIKRNTTVGSSGYFPLTFEQLMKAKKNPDDLNSFTINCNDGSVKHYH